MAWFLIDADESAAIKELIRFESVPGVDDEVETALHEAIIYCRKNARVNYQSALKKGKRKEVYAGMFLAGYNKKITVHMNMGINITNYRKKESASDMYAYRGIIYSSGKGEFNVIDTNGDNDEYFRQLQLVFNHYGFSVLRSDTKIQYRNDPNCIAKAYYIYAYV